MRYKKAFAKKFVLPVNYEEVKFFKSSKSNSLYHIFIPRNSGNHKSICGFSLKKTSEVTEPDIIAEICAKCLKGQYSFYEQDLPFDTQLWVDYFNDLTLVESQLNKNHKGFVDEIEISDIIQKQLDYEIMSLNVQNEIKQCNHVYLVYIMRYNNLTSLECHNCQQDIALIDCICDDPMTIDFVDTDANGNELQRDMFCMRCNGYLLRDINQFL